MGIAKNRQVAVHGSKYTQVQNLTITDVGLVVYLKEFGYVKVFCHAFTGEVDRYAHHVFTRAKCYSATDQNRI